MATFSSPEGAARKKINLMSIVESLHPESFLGNPPGVSNIIHDQSPTGVNPSVKPVTAPSTNVRPRDSGTEPVIVIEDEAMDSEEPTGGGDDPLENLFNLLNGLASRANAKNEHVPPPENDETLLQMQHPPEGKKAGIQTLIQSYANGTSDVRSILNNDINFIYECKRCRGMFRSLPNLIRHKKEYCKNTGVLSSFMDRPTNSTQAEDESFKNFLDTLYPPEPPAYTLPLSSPPVNKARSGGFKPPATISNLKPVRVNLVQVNSASGGTSTSYTITSSKPGQIVPIQNTVATSNTGKNLRLVVNQVVKPIPHATKALPAAGSLVPVSSVLSATTNICPICDKSFSGRKSVRRHLINVHMVCYNEAVKMMNSSNTIKKSKSKQAGGMDLAELAVESIKLAPDQIIRVLPQNVQISSAECPICGRQLCRKSNVRRHLVEAHKMVIKNDNKYWKLREIASSNLSTSPSARALRYLFSSEASNLSSVKKIMPVTNSMEKVKPIEISKPIPLSILPLATTTVGGTKKSGPLSINKVTFVESNPLLSASVKILQALPSSVKPSTKSIMPEKTSLVKSRQENVKLPLSNGNYESENESLEQSNVENDATKVISNSAKKNDVDPTYKCSPCNKVFSRRQTYQNHMYTFHKSSGEELEKKPSSQRASSSNTLRKRSAHDGSEDSDSEPLQKLRKRRNTDSNKQLASFRSQEDDTESMPLQKLCKLSSVFFPNGAKSSPSNPGGGGPLKQGTAQQRSKFLSQDRTSGSVTSVNGGMDRNTDTVPLATTTTILSSSVIDPGDSSEPKKEKVTALTQNFVLRRLSLDNSRSSTVTMLRPIIKVQLKNSAVAAKASESNQTDKNSPQGKKQPNAAKRTVQYDFANLHCHTCSKTFPNTPDLKSHLLSVHSLTEEEARSSCYDLSPVRKDIQESGLEHGFDINQAKCLLCSRHYFSREILYKHLSRFHHLEDEALEGLKESVTLTAPKITAVRNGGVHQKVIEQSKTLKQELSASTLLQELAATSTSQQSKETSTAAKSLKSPVTLTSNPFFISEERAAEALKYFPKEYVNTTALRCTKCKHRYHKAWDLKMHLLRHLKIGLFACRYCKDKADLNPIVRSGDLIKHLSQEHNVRITAKNRERYFTECRVNLANLWEAYGLPAGKIR